MLRREDLERELKRSNALTEGLPFIEILESSPVNTNVRVIGLECFDEATYPKDHTCYYESLMYVLNYNETTKYQLFVSTLKLHARAWFTALPP